MALANTAALGTTGATIGGTVGGPVGAGIGAVLGGLTGGIADLISSGKKKKAAKVAALVGGGQPAQFQQTNMPGVSQYSVLTPQQQLLQNQAIRNALQILQTGQTPGFEPLAQEARANFATKTVPLLAERFGGSGMERGSSALTGQLAAAGAGLDRGLAALQSQYSQNQLGQLFGPSLRTPFELAFQQQQPQWYETIGGDVLQYLPQLLALFNQSQNSPQLSQSSGFTPINTQQSRSSLENLIPNIVQQGTQNQPGMPGYQYGQLPRPNFLGGGTL